MGKMDNKKDNFKRIAEKRTNKIKVPKAEITTAMIAYTEKL